MKTKTITKMLGIFVVLIFLTSATVSAKMVSATPLKGRPSINTNINTDLQPLPIVNPESRPWPIEDFCRTDKDCIDYTDEDEIPNCREVQINSMDSSLDCGIPKFCKFEGCDAKNGKCRGNKSKDK